MAYPTGFEQLLEAILQWQEPYYRERELGQRKREAQAQREIELGRLGLERQRFEAEKGYREKEQKLSEEQLALNRQIAEAQDRHNAALENIERMRYNIESLRYIDEHKANKLDREVKEYELKVKKAWDEAFPISEQVKFQKTKQEYELRNLNKELAVLDLQLAKTKAELAAINAEAKGIKVDEKNLQRFYEARTKIYGVLSNLFYGETDYKDYVSNWIANGLDNKDLLSEEQWKLVKDNPTQYSNFINRLITNNSSKAAMIMTGVEKSWFDPEAIKTYFPDYSISEITIPKPEITERKKGWEIPPEERTPWQRFVYGGPKWKKAEEKVEEFSKKAEGKVGTALKEAGSFLKKGAEKLLGGEKKFESQPLDQAGIGATKPVTPQVIPPEQTGTTLRAGGEIIQFGKNSYRIIQNNVYDINFKPITDEKLKRQILNYYYIQKSQQKYGQSYGRGAY